MFHSQGQYLVEAKLISPDIRLLDPPKPDEVQIAVRSTTICGSDLHYFSTGRNGSIVPREPLCLGHEASGEVVKVDQEVRDLKPGDRVAIEPGVPCETCEICKEGRYNICPHLRFRGSGSVFPHFQGMLQQRINHPARYAHKLPPSFTFEAGALLEPVSVAIHAVRRASLQPGQSCLVFGAGAIGLLCAAAARFVGCGVITIADIDSNRLDFAKNNRFADLCYRVESKRGSSSLEEQLDFAKDIAADIRLLSSPDQTKPPCTFECTGAEVCVQASIYATRAGGKVLLVGMGLPNHTLPVAEASSREIDLIPTWRYANCYPDAIQLMAASLIGGSGLPPLITLVTHRFEGLEKVNDAFATAGKGKDDDGRIVIKVAVSQ